MLRDWKVEHMVHDESCWLFVEEHEDHDSIL